MYKKWKFNHSDGDRGWMCGAAQNVTAVGGGAVPWITCPSNPMTESFAPCGPAVPGPSYVGISGAMPTALNGLSEPQGWDGNASSPGWQYMSFQGTSPISNWNGNKNFIKIRDITDGTANTFLTGELSGWVFDTVTGAKTDMRASGGLSTWGWAMGNHNGWPVLQVHSLTLRYPPNYRVPNVISSTANIGVNTSNWPWTSANTPLTSAHAGGVHTLMTDGTVKFINNTINMSTYAYLGCRADSKVAAQY